MGGGNLGEEVLILSKMMSKPIWNGGKSMREAATVMVVGLKHCLVS